ncbi:MAG: GAF domain-containing protein [Comamonadaceae bacterium]|nr:MAG: GAF domain-containing protein [Comamonadaceae bacterium]
MTSPRSPDPSSTELHVATSEGARRLDGPIGRLLHLIREELEMDVAFVSEFVDGQRVLRHVDVGPGAEIVVPGLSHPLEDTLCQRVLDGRMPQVVPDLPELRKTIDLPEMPIAIGAHLSVPVQRQDGRVYGMLCCFSFDPDPSVGERHLKRLEMSARLAARLLDEAAGTSPLATPLA